jgi:hypothetical protein
MGRRHSPFEAQGKEEWLCQRPHFALGAPHSHVALAASLGTLDNSAHAAAKDLQLVAITFRFHYPLERTMAFEREYHPNLRLSLLEKRELLKSAITIWMLEDGKLVGETYGVPWSGKDDMMGFPRDPEAIYCYSNTILRKYQGKGYGAILKAVFIGRVSRDFKRIYGHARPGASQALNKKFGARMGKTYKNWFATGEDYRMYVLRLGK